MSSAFNRKLLVIGIGAQKTGSSWLSHFLKSHQDVYSSSIKEMHYFQYYKLGGTWPNSYFQRRLQQLHLCEELSSFQQRQIHDLVERVKMDGSVSAYKKFYERRISNESVYCDFTPAYSMLPVTELIRIRENFDRVKLVFVMRNPAERFWSQMRFSERALTEENVDDLLGLCISNPEYIKRSDYKSTLDRTFSVFNKEDVFVEFYENLFSETAIERLCNFIGISFTAPDLKKRRNKAGSLPMLSHQRRRLVETLDRQYREVHRLYINKLPNNWKLDMEQI